MIDEQKRLLLQRQALEDLKERIAAESYLTVPDLMDRLNLSREKIVALPFEVLPYADVGSPGRSMRRYHPADVVALDARLRRWRAAQSRGEGEAYLRQLREQLDARDEAALELAEEGAA